MITLFKLIFVVCPPVLAAWKALHDWKLHDKRAPKWKTKAIWRFTLTIIIGSALAFLFGGIAIYLEGREKLQAEVRRAASEEQADRIESNTVATRAVENRAQTEGDNSPVLQAGNNATINYTTRDPNAATKQDVAALRTEIAGLLKARAVTSQEALTAKYPQGYILLGVADGRIVYEPRLKSIQVDADWNNATLSLDYPRNIGKIFIPKVHVIAGGLNMRISVGIHHEIPLIENVPIRDRTFFVAGKASMYYEVIDASKKIFVIGFR